MTAYEAIEASKFLEKLKIPKFLILTENCQNGL